MDFFALDFLAAAFDFLLLDEDPLLDFFAEDDFPFPPFLDFSTVGLPPPAGAPPPPELLPPLGGGRGGGMTFEGDPTESKRSLLPEP